MIIFCLIVHYLKQNSVQPRLLNVAVLIGHRTYYWEHSLKQAVMQLYSPGGALIRIEQLYGRRHLQLNKRASSTVSRRNSRSLWVCLHDEQQRRAAVWHSDSLRVTRCDSDSVSQCKRWKSCTTSSLSSGFVLLAARRHTSKQQHIQPSSVSHVPSILDRLPGFCYTQWTIKTVQLLFRL